jgi:hypothetical protein
MTMAEWDMAVARVVEVCSKGYERQGMGDKKEDWADARYEGGGLMGDPECWDKVSHGESWMKRSREVLGVGENSGAVGDWDRCRCQRGRGVEPWCPVIPPESHSDSL